MQIDGTTDPKFRKVKEAFASTFEDGIEHGAGVAVMIDGRMVAELWGGHADASKTKSWQRDTLVNVWSCTKAVVATAVAMAVERGQLRYGAPIAAVWPEFAAHGKDGVTLDHVMSHCAGLQGFTAPVGDDIIFDWARSTAVLANQKPITLPGSVCAYHALTYGHLAGEVLRRATGRTIGKFIADEIAKPLGVDFHVGVSAVDDARCAEIIEGAKASNWIVEVLSSKYPEACRNPTPVATWPNERLWRAAEIPGGNGHCTAAGLATIYGDLVGGKSKLLSKEGLREASRERFGGQDESFNLPTSWAAGFRLADADNIPLASAGTISHGGWGGSFGFGDPEAKLGFAFVTNHMLGFDDGVDPRRKRLIDAVYGAL